MMMISGVRATRIRPTHINAHYLSQCKASSAKSISPFPSSVIFILALLSSNSPQSEAIYLQNILDIFHAPPSHVYPQPITSSLKVKLVSRQLTDFTKILIKN
jgi:hypothetical protein